MQPGLKSKFDMPQATHIHEQPLRQFTEQYFTAQDIPTLLYGKWRTLSPCEEKNLPKFFNYNLICKWHRERNMPRNWSGKLGKVKREN